MLLRKLGKARHGADDQNVMFAAYAAAARFSK